MQVQFERLGLSEGVPVGRVGTQETRLLGDLGGEQGLWWGEGEVVGLAPLTVSVTARLTEPRDEPSRLEILFPVVREPWFAVDLSRLRRNSETQPLARQAALRAWVPGGWDTEDGVGRTELSANDASRLFHMLLNQPTDIHCLHEVHDGSNWAPWSEHHLVVCYSQNRQLNVHPDQPPPGTSAIKDCAFHTPYWVDLYRGEERLVRWGQPRMLKRRRYI